MTCHEVNDYLDRTSLRDWERLPEILRTHLNACQCCRGLWELLSRRPCPKQLLPQVRTRIEDELLGSLQPVKPLPGPGRLAFGFLVIFGGLSTLMVLGFARPQAPGLNSLSYASIVLVALVGAVLASVTLGREMVPGQRRDLPLSFTISTGLAGLFAAIVLVFPWQITENHFAGHAWHCFKAGCMLALPAAGLSLLLLRRGAVLSPDVAGAATGLLASLVGVVALHFTCATQEAPHLALGHVGVPVAGTLMGYAAGRLLPAKWFGAPRIERLETSQG